MKQEDKELLLQDLCGRLPYGTNIYYKTSGWEDKNCTLTPQVIDNFLIRRDVIIKPYLRPLSSMTEEEYNEMFNEFYLAQEEFSRDYSNTCFVGKIIGNDMVRLDWLNKNMFDFRWLIRKGLALEAPEGMYNEK